MPHTINGIGTWYWGKSNLLVQDSTCKLCGSFARLTSYDTTLYFVVFFLPVIPLGRKRIIQKCPLCQRHRVVPLHKWEANKTEAIVETINEWRAQPGDSAKARTA